MATITVTPTQTFVSGNTVTPATLNQLAQSTVALTAGTIVDADVSASAAIAASKLAATLDLSSKTVTLPDGSVTTAKLATATAQALLPAGAVMPFAMNSAPSGWLAANGSEYAKTGTYAALFSAIGTTYGETNGSGGAGNTHFRVPDLRGYFVRGAGTNAFTGVAAGTFGQRQAESIKDHTHAYSLGTNRNVASGAAFGVQGSDTAGAAVATSTVLPPNHDGAETRPANIALLYCIKF